MITGFDSRHFRVASLPVSWKIPSLDKQLANLSETFEGMSFASPVVNDPVHTNSGYGYIYAPRQRPLLDYYSLQSYSDLTWRITERAQIDCPNFSIHGDIMGNEITPEESLFNHLWNMDRAGRHDWVIRCITTGWMHQGYSANQTVYRCNANQQYPLGLWQYAALILAIQPKLVSAENHFLVCAGDTVSVRGTYCAPKFRLHHAVELGYQDQQSADCYTGAISYIL